PQAVHYELHVGDGADLDRVFAGDFSETYKQQRIGRRGGVPVRVVHAVEQHRITSSSGKDLSLSLADLKPEQGSVTVEVFRSPVSLLMLAIIGVILTVAALVVDVLRPDTPSDGLMTIETISAVVALIAFRQLAHAHPAFGDLIIDGALAGA